MSTLVAFCAALNTDSWMLPLTGALVTSDTSVMSGAVVDPYTTSV